MIVILVWMSIYFQRIWKESNANLCSTTLGRGFLLCLLRTVCIFVIICLRLISPKDLNMFSKFRDKWCLTVRFSSLNRFFFLLNSDFKIIRFGYLSKCQLPGSYKSMWSLSLFCFGVPVILKTFRLSWMHVHNSLDLSNVTSFSNWISFQRLKH